MSPELALVDPALARADLARRRPEPWKAAPTLRTAAGRRAPGHLRAAATLLVVSLAANGFLAAVALTRKPAVVAAPPVTVTVVPTLGSATSAQLRPASTPSTVAPPAPRHGPPAPPARASAHVEQKILSLLVASPRGRLPRALIDPRTGLAANNLQAECHPSPGKSFLCVVRPARHRAGEGLRVRYVPRENGGARIVWGSYRRG